MRWLFDRIGHLPIGVLGDRSVASMDRRVIGIETEFGCLVRDDQVGTRPVSGCYSHFLMTLALRMPFRSTTTVWITLAGIHLAVMRTTWFRWRMKSFSGRAYVG